MRGDAYYTRAERATANAAHGTCVWLCCQQMATLFLWSQRQSRTGNGVATARDPEMQQQEEVTTVIVGELQG